MDSNKVAAVSKRSQAYILIKHGYYARDTAQLIGKSSFLSRSGQNMVRMGHLRGRKAAEDLLKFQVKFKLPLKSLSTSAINLQESSIES